jgi:hypothetical protein
MLYLRNKHIILYTGTHQKKNKKNSDEIHVAMTKTCGLVATLACQSNTFYSKFKRKRKKRVDDCCLCG